MWVHPSYVTIIKNDISTRWLKIPSNHIKQGGFASAIGPYNTQYFGCMDIKVKVIKRRQPAKVFT
jgi:hypothetical protein